MITELFKTENATKRHGMITVITSEDANGLHEKEVHKQIRKLFSSENGVTEFKRNDFKRKYKREKRVVTVITY